ncbi:metallophosphoesterase [Oceanobacillus longus]|uniref:Metallophosphoesterase n=1 Tax=Oceanobacillus longus TaxID=930120 RepID=A0ABV8GWF1_9BACI
MFKQLLKPLLIAPLPFIFMIYKAHHDVLQEQTIVDERLPEGLDGFRIFFISDIHRRNIRKSTLSSISLKVDAVIIGGDLTEKWVPLERSRKNIRALKKWNVPIYFVWGNNDYDAGKEKIAKLLQEENVTILQESIQNIYKNNQILSLIGFDYYEDKRDQVGTALSDARGDYKILIAHSPTAIEELSEEEQYKIHTFLAGHTHGGQIRFLGYGPYKKGGYELFHTTHKLVSEGYGYRLLPFRLVTNAECHVVTFQNKQI